MIPYNDITAWGNDHQWVTREQIEQDLLLSQAICEISKDELLGSELIFRGGTALHKIFCRKPCDIVKISTMCVLPQAVSETL